MSAFAYLSIRQAGSGQARADERQGELLELIAAADVTIGETLMAKGLAG